MRPLDELLRNLYKSGEGGPEEVQKYMNSLSPEEQETVLQWANGVIEKIMKAWEAWTNEILSRLETTQQKPIGILFGYPVKEDLVDENWIWKEDMAPFEDWAATGKVQAMLKGLVSDDKGS